MPKSVLDTLAVSLFPDEAIGILTEVRNTLVVFEPTDVVIGYTGRLLVHTLGFPDDPKLKEECIDLLRVMQLDPEDFPAMSIRGWVTAAKIFQYNDELFAKEADLHGHGDSLVVYQGLVGLMGKQAWGVRVKDPFWLDPPVIDVLPPEDTNNGEFWLPTDPMQLEAFKLALKSEVESEETEGEEAIAED